MESKHRLNDSEIKENRQELKQLKVFRENFGAETDLKLQKNTIQDLKKQLEERKQTLLKLEERSLEVDQQKKREIIEKTKEIIRIQQKEREENPNPVLQKYYSRRKRVEKTKIRSIYKDENDENLLAHPKMVKKQILRANL